MSYRVRYTKAAQNDIERLFEALLEIDWYTAERAMNAIDKATEILEAFPFACRKADPNNPFLRELLVTFGKSGYVALYEIEDERTVTILAVRHRREDDFL